MKIRGKARAVHLLPAIFVCHAAAAQVTLYGVVDTGIIQDKTEGSRARWGLDNGLYIPSRFGLRGVERLTPDMTAFFVLENGFAPDTGQATNNGRLFGRNAYVGLRSAEWGEIRLGRSLNLTQLWTPAVVSPFGLGMGRNSAGTTLAFDDDAFGNGRVDNSVYYLSPMARGLQWGMGYSFNIGTALPGAPATTEVAGAGANSRMVDAGLRYVQGPWTAILSYMRTQVANGGSRPSSLTAVASYDFGAFRLHAGYGRLRDAVTEPSGRVIPNPGWLTPQRKDDQAYTLGMTLPAGNGKWMASYHRTTSSRIVSYGLGYYHGLSKRTGVYAFVNGGKGRDFIHDSNVSRRQFAVGVSHSF
ncbi:MAG: hypothetical protein ABT00_06110 [Bordetella sp. SCN 68-11]|nr:MAG: hypothetical protein ABT00_06110 [Bordetella sp. SCN 68-11]